MNMFLLIFILFTYTHFLNVDISLFNLYVNTYYIGICVISLLLRIVCF